MKVNGFKLARIKAGLSQEEAAAKLGVSRVTVTAAGEHGAIYQAWAGDFHGSPSPAEIVTA